MNWRRSLQPSISTFSIAVPIGAWHPFLPAALRSLALQTPRPAVAILNASNDDRVDQALNESGLTFAYRRDGPDAGQSNAIMEGWLNTQSTYLGWLNADDILLSGALQAAEVALHEQNRPAVVHAGSVILDPSGRVIGLHSQVSQVTGEIARSNPISQPSCFMRRSAVERVGGLDTRLHYVMDWDLWTRLHEAGETFASVQDIWSAVHWGPETKTASFSRRRLREIFELTRARSGTLKALKTLLAMSTDGRPISRLLYRLSRSGRSMRRSDGLHLTASHHPGEAGRPTALVRIPNIFQTPRTCLEVTFDGAPARVSATGAQIEVAAPGVWVVRFSRAVQSGEDVALKLTAPKHGAACFRSAQWRAGA